VQAGSRPSRRSCRGDLFLLWPGERTGSGDVNSRLPMEAPRCVFFLWHQFDGDKEKRRKGKKRRSSPETRGCASHDSFNSSTAGGKELKRSHTMGSFFQRLSGFHQRVGWQVPGPPVQPPTDQDGTDGTLELGSARVPLPLSRACSPKLVCLSTQACFCSEIAARACRGAKATPQITNASLV